MTGTGEAVTRNGALIVVIADLAGTFLFAIEGAAAAVAAGLDPIGILTLAFVALGGGVLRDLLIGTKRPAAIDDWRYAAIVLGAVVAIWWAHPVVGSIPPLTMTLLDAAGLALLAVAGTEKALDNGVHPLPAIFLGTLGSVGGGAIRDILLNQVPRILYTDIYASAACAAAAIVASARAARWSPRIAAVTGGLVCFGLRTAAILSHWQLPRLV